MMETKQTNIDSTRVSAHQPSLKKERAVLVMGVFTSILFLISSILVFSNVLRNHPDLIWAHIAFGALLAVTAGFHFFVGLGFLRFKPTLRILILLSLVYLCMGITSVAITNAGPPAAIIALAYSVSMGTSAGYGRQTNRIITTGVIGSVLISLANLFPPISQITIPDAVNVLWINVAALAVTFLTLLLSGVIIATLRIKLLTFAIASALIPLGLASYFSIQSQLNTLEVQFRENISLTASQMVDQVEEFFKTNEEKSTLDANFPVFARYLKMPADQRSGSEVEQELITTTQTLDKFRQQSFIMGYGLLDSNGMVVYDTNVAKIGSSEASQQFFTIPFTEGLVYISPIQFPIYESSNIVFSSPITDDEEKVLGVLRIQYNASVFSNLVKTTEDIYGDKAYPVLLDGNGFRIVDSLHPEMMFEPVAQITEQHLYDLKKEELLPMTTTGKEYAFSPALATAIQQSSTSPFYNANVDPDQDSTEEIIYTSQLKFGSPPYYLAYVQKQDQVLAAFKQQQNNMILAATLIAGVIGILASLVSRLISMPILKLTATAEQITEGNINAYANIRSQDELGYLANAFNVMTERLRDLINSLEDRVKARTDELAEQNKALVFRSQQLNTVSEVAKSITSTRELEQLFEMVTRLISERFGFYHAGIFLLDERGEYAVLRAANSKGGKRMLENQHKLKVGQTGLVGYVTGKGQPRIATDVGEDSVHFNNPLLPETRSEMALPLIADQKIIGALDVQSKNANAFSPEDIELFTILADQIAIAITNDALLEETARALSQMQGLHRQYLQQEWQKESGRRTDQGYLFTPLGLSRQEAIQSPEIEKAIEMGEPVLEVHQVDGKTTENILAVPIQLRGETIGTIHLKENSEDSTTWDDNEITVVKEVSDQIALALENARLFEQTVRRADRERKVIEITGQIRSTNDPQEMLRIAAAALQKELRGARAQVILQKQQTEPDEIPSNGNQPASANAD